MGMRLMIEKTDEIRMVDGIECRIWEGTTDAGTPCLVFIHRVAIREDFDKSEFDRELQGRNPPANVGEVVKGYDVRKL